MALANVCGAAGEAGEEVLPFWTVAVGQLLWWDFPCMSLCVRTALIGLSGLKETDKI